MDTINLNYEETLHYLYTQLPMFQRSGPMAMKKDLTNILKLMAVLENPHQQFQSIHIAGTNGKGSVAHLLSAVFQAAGYKTGVYTSPHYKDFRERIKIDGSFISKKEVVAFVHSNKTHFEEIRPSFFEITVALAFEHFAKEKVDIAIIETGLGGRLDSTNILNPLISIITNISYDHQNFLGDTLPAIATEKAGIIKTNTPVLIGESQAEVVPVFMEKAKEKKAPLYFADAHYQVKRVRWDKSNTYFEVKNEKKKFEKVLPVNIHGPFQTKNIATALAALDLIKEQGFYAGISVEDMERGFFHLKDLTQYIGRFTFIQHRPDILIDSAHNVAGLSLLFDEIKTLTFEKLRIVYGTVADKDFTPVFPILPQKAQYYFVKANIPRAHDAVSLQEKAAEQNLKGSAYSSVKEGLAAAKTHANPNDLIVVCGSIFVVAEVL